jgi:putative FmdB family regulatory protein
MMPIYGYRCNTCKTVEDRMIPLVRADAVQTCQKCGMPMEKQLSAPLFRFYGRVTPGGGMDKFTADMLGIPLKELPEGLKGQNDL